MRRLGKSIGKLLLFLLPTLAALALLASILALAKAGNWLMLFWRLCCAAGGLVLLLAAVLLLTGGRKQYEMKRWEQNFPGLSFKMALILVGTILILVGCLANYLAF